MSSLTRFECPRCQHVFVASVGDDAFADCPQCKSMALAVGDATSAGMSFDSVPASLSQAPVSLPSLEEGPLYSTSGEGAPQAEEPRGVFTQLLDSTSAFEVEVDLTSENLRALPASQPPSLEGAASDEGSDFGEATEAVGIDLGLLQLSLQRDADDERRASSSVTEALGQHSASTREPSDSAEDDSMDRAPTHILRSPAAISMETKMDWEEPAVSSDATARASDPSPPPPPPPPSSSPEGGAANAAILLTRAEPAARAILLSDLEAQLGGGMRIDEAAAEMSGQERNALEQAFSAMAGVAGPTKSAAVPGSSPTSREAAAPSALRRKRGGPPQLSEEAKALAGIPLDGESAASNLAHQLTRTPETASRTPPRPTAAPSTGAAARGEQDRAQAASARQRAGGQAAPTRPRKAPLPPPTGPFAGFTAPRIAALVFGGAVLGLGAGALIAPSPTPPPVTPRTTAEAQLSQGNRFYQEGRFDDALGSYRGAVAADDTYAAAHRAKGVALAKQQRSEEAAEAYRRYLELAPDAPDAAQVREVLGRFENTGGAP